VRKGPLLVFTEVKTRLAGHGSPLESFTQAKATQVRRMAAHWMSANGRAVRVSSIRLDAVAVVIDSRGDLVSLDCLEGAM